MIILINKYNTTTANSRIILDILEATQRIISHRRMNLREMAQFARVHGAYLLVTDDNSHYVRYDNFIDAHGPKDKGLIGSYYALICGETVIGESMAKMGMGYNTDILGRALDVDTYEDREEKLTVMSVAPAYFWFSL